MHDFLFYSKEFVHVCYNNNMIVKMTHFSQFINVRDAHPGTLTALPGSGPLRPVTQLVESNTLWWKDRCRCLSLLGFELPLNFRWPSSFGDCGVCTGTRRLPSEISPVKCGIPFLLTVENPCICRCQVYKMIKKVESSTSSSAW